MPWFRRSPSARAGRAAPAAPAADGAPPVRLDDPKRLRRVVDRVLSAPPPADPTAAAASIPSALDEIGPELGVRALAWFSASGGVFERRRVVGAEMRFVETVDGPIALRLAPRPRRAHVYLDPREAAAPAALGLMAPAPSAAFRFDAAPHESLVLVALHDGADPHVTEFVLGTLASALSARALQDRWRRSLDEAAEIQRGLLPSSIPEVAGLAVAARSVAAEDVGGDLYDFFPFGPGTLGIAVGDASGHGLPAALVARDVVVGMRVGLDRGLRVGGVLSRLNRVLRAGVPERAFASLVYVEAHADGALEYACAGHPPPLLVRRHTYTALRQGGPVLGPVEHVAYRRTSARLERGETLVLYTDGVTERRDASGELYGEERLAAAVGARSGLPADAALEGVLDDVRAFGDGAPWADDLTLVLVRRTGAGKSAR
ncbi:MAG: PP2C family protein-serine/threonine phosphatase [Planctomycetes bacterium]|nr:PP2C family protein-serine/threonine phosphatase [Planctomycetota bacterium]